MDNKGKILLLFGVFLIAAILSTEAQLPCSSRLRYIRPHLFRHCGCRYTDWTEWEMVPNTLGVDTSGNCESGEAFNETRRQKFIGENCEKRVENRSMCAPTQADRLIIQFKLGPKPPKPPPPPSPSPAKPEPPSGSKPEPPSASSNPPTASSDPPTASSDATTASSESSTTMEPSTTMSSVTTKAPVKNKRSSPDSYLKKKVKRQAMCDQQPFCRQFWQGKRSVREDIDISDRKNSGTEVRNEIEHHDPIPFSVREHGHRYRRNVNNCQPGDTQHVLFVLDTSGSIRRSDFDRMTDVIAEMTTLFCDPIKVAVLTFSHEFYLEFCFDCFGPNDIFEQLNKIRNIPYRGGSTLTGGAAKCVCDELLDDSCGISFVDSTCLEVIFITDGQSNDQNFQICNEIKCLHNHVLKLNTYSLGIGNYYNNAQARAELQCIQDSSNEQSLFKFTSFQEFFDEFSEVESKLSDPKNTQYICTDTDGKLGTISPPAGK